jgi:hypothetical protein
VKEVQVVGLFSFTYHRQVWTNNGALQRPICGDPAFLITHKADTNSTRQPACRKPRSALQARGDVQSTADENSFVLRLLQPLEGF